jgi:DNA repair protein RadA/Sms
LQERFLTETLFVSLGIDKNKTKQVMSNYYQRQKAKRLAQQQAAATFNAEDIRTYTGYELRFDDRLFIPMKTLKEIDTIMSTEGGIMPATAMMLAGGPGSGKTTITLDMLSSLTKQGYRCLFVSGEMDQIGYYKYTRRMPQIQNVETLFLRDYALRVKDVLEHVFDIGYDIICVDSIAEVIDLYKDGYSVTEGMAEHWYLQLLDKHKKGNNSRGVNTSFISIQQQTKAGDFVGSNRLKHMMDSCAHIKKNKETGERSMWFSKNRDCGFDYTLHFDIDGEGVRYHFGPVEGEDHDE